MPDRSYVFEGIQIGVEAAGAGYGISVAAVRKLNSLGIAVRPQVETMAFRPMGQKTDTLVIPGRDWSTARLTGKPTYNELTYALASIMTTATPVTTAAIATPTVAPTLLAAAGTSTFGAGTFLVAYTWITATGGETAIGPTASVVLTAGQQINVSAIPALPVGASAAKLYVSDAGLTVLYNSTVTTAIATATLVAVRATGAPQPPLSNNTGSSVWTFVMNDSQPDAPNSYTIEAGSSVRAAKLTGGIFTDFAFTINRHTWDLTGALLGQLYTDGVTLTASPSELGLLPLLPKTVDIYMDATPAALGTTKLLRAFQVTTNLGNRYGPVWPLNSTLASYATYIELVPRFGGTLRMEMDSAGGTELVQLRAGNTRFMRIKVTDTNLIQGAVPYTLTWDMAVKYNQAADLADYEGVTTIDWPYTLVHDPSWGKTAQVVLTNSLPAL